MTDGSMAWQPIEIRRVDSPLGTSTGATRVETDRGPAYAKFLGNPEGPHVLACELIGTRAAAWLALPILDFALIEVEEPALVSYSNGTTSAAGTAFVTRYEKGITWGGADETLAAIDNPDDLAGLVVTVHPIHFHPNQPPIRHEPDPSPLNSEAWRTTSPCPAANDKNSSSFEPRTTHSDSSWPM